MIKIENLWKKYETNEVLKGVNLTLSQGEVYALVGKNGAGKTTLMNIMARLLNFESGNITFSGEDFKKSKTKISYVLDIPALYEFMTAREYLSFLASTMSDTQEQIKQKMENVMERVGLKDAINTRISKYSRGMKQRFGIAAGIFCDPEVIILDEPCSALDPEGRFEVNRIISSIAKEGKTVMLSTHILSDVEKICNKIGLLINGVISYEGTVANLFEQHSEPVYEISTSNNASLLTKIENLGQIIFSDDNKIVIRVEDENRQKLQTAIFESELKINNYQKQKVSLEQIFVKMSGGRIS